MADTPTLAIVTFLVRVFVKKPCEINKKLKIYSYNKMWKYLFFVASFLYIASAEPTIACSSVLPCYIFQQQPTLYVAPIDSTVVKVIDPPVSTVEKVNEEKIKTEKVKEPKVKEEKVKEPKVKEEKVKEPKVKEPKVKEPKVKEPKVKESK